MPQPNQLAIQIRLEGQNQVVTAVQQVQSQFNTFQQTLKAGFELNLGAKMAETVLQSVGAFRQAISQGLQYAANLKDMSIQSGLTSEAVQVLGQAAALSGAGIENVRAALTNLRQAATEAQGGNEDLSAAFKQLGLEAKIVTTLPLEAQLEAVSRGFATNANDGRTFSAVIRLLGERDAPRLQGMLLELAQRGLPGMASALRESGALLDSEMIDKADELDDRWGELGTKFRATFAGLGLLLQPLISGLQWLVGKALDGLNLLVQAFRNLATAMGAIGAVLTGADWQTAWEEFLNTANGGNRNLQGKATPSALVSKPGNKGTGPTMAEMAAEQERLTASMLPLWQQQQAAQAVLAKAEQERQRLIAEGNAKGQIDTEKLMTASLAVTKAKQEAWKIDQQITTEIDRQQQQSVANADLAASMLPLAAQRQHAQENLTAAEQDLATLLADQQADAKALLDAESARLRAKQALKALDEQIAREQAEKQNQAALDVADSKARQLAAERAELEGDLTRTTQEKWAERKRILAEEITNQQALLDLLTAKREAARASGDTAGAAVYDQSARSVSTGLSTLQNQQSGLGPDPSSFGQQITSAITSAQTSVGSFAQQIGTAFSSVGESIRTNLGGALSDMVMKGTSFKNAMLGFGQAIATSFINTGAQMVADWIYSHVIMEGVRSAFHAMGITQKAAATTTEVGIHAAGEAAKTGATATGGAARKTLMLGETIFHGIQVGLRTAAHFVGELLMTGISIVQQAIRLPLILAETGAWLVKAAVQAISALSVIPVVGPFLGIAAAAAVLAAGASIMSKAFATGGLVTGPGTGTSDSIPARLSNGEFVNRAASVNKFGAPFFEALNAGVLDLSSLPDRVTAGMAQPYYAAAAPTASTASPTTASEQTGGVKVYNAFFNDRPSAERWLQSKDGHRNLIRMRGDLGMET